MPSPLEPLNFLGFASEATLYVVKAARNWVGINVTALDLLYLDGRWERRQAVSSSYVSCKYAADRLM